MVQPSSIQSTDDYRLWNRAILSSTDTKLRTLSTCPLFPLSTTATGTDYIHFYLFHGPPMVAHRFFGEKGLTVGNIRCTKYMVD